MLENRFVLLICNFLIVAHLKSGERREICIRGWFLRLDVNMFLCVAQYARVLPLLPCRWQHHNNNKKKFVLVVGGRRGRKSPVSSLLHWQGDSEYNNETIISGLKVLKHFQIFCRLQVRRILCLCDSGFKHIWIYLKSLECESRV